MFEIYQDKKGKWRWRLIAKNGRIVADSGQGYSRRDAVLRAIVLVCTEVNYAGIREVIKE